MSSSEQSHVLSALEQKVLVHIAKELGPSLDRIDPGCPTLEVRSIVLRFVSDGEVSPAEVRHALIRLIVANLLAHGREQNDDDLLNPACLIGLRIAGLMAARTLVPGVGGATNSFSLRLGRFPPPFGAWFDTGDKTKDGAFNRKGSILGALYALAILGADDTYPARLAAIVECAELLAVHGIKARSGPTRSEKLGVSAESISKALRQLQPLLPGLREVSIEGDGGSSYWAMKGAWPNIIVRGKDLEIRDWPTLVNRLRQAVREARETRARKSRMGG